MVQYVQSGARSERRDVVQFCREAHAWTEKQIKAGAEACEIAKEASEATGKHMVECTLQWLREAIV